MEFHGEICYTGYVIIIDDYTPSQLLLSLLRTFVTYYFSYPIPSYNPQFRKFMISTT